MRPDLWKAIVAEVPFVDVVTTMLDDTIPLTTGEFDEWGDPSEKAAYERMLSYSPYDNVHDAKYPAMLVLSGFHDSQVQYWEPAKWVQRLREHQQGDHGRGQHRNPLPATRLRAVAGKSAEARREPMSGLHLATLPSCRESPSSSR
jgi:oligopeptidase B